MSTKIGGPHRCNIHPEFITDDTNEFNEHCATTEGHTTTGSYPCSGCGCEIKVEQIPFQPIGKEVKLQCPECFNKNQDLNRLVNDAAFLKSQEQQQFQQGAQGESLK